MNLKKKSIWFALLLIIPIVVLVHSIYVQVKYLNDLHEMRDNQFAEKVSLALTNAFQEVQGEMLAEYTNALLKEHADSLETAPQKEENPQYRERVKKLLDWNDLLKVSGFVSTSPSSLHFNEKKQQEILCEKEDYDRLVDAYFYYSKTLRDVILNSILTLSYDMRPLQERLSAERIDEAITQALSNVGVNEPYSFTIYDDQNVRLTGIRENLSDKGTHPKNKVRHNLFDDFFFGKKYVGYAEVSFFEPDRYIKGSDYLLSVLSTSGIFLLLTILAIVSAFREMSFERNRKHFVDNLTHELKTPLTSIAIATDMLTAENATYSEDSRKRMLKALKSETKRLGFLVEKLLQFTLLDEGKNWYDYTMVEAHELLRPAVVVMGMKCKQLDGYLELKAEAEDSQIRVDKTHFQNIIFNLLDNAVKYRKSDIPPEIIITTKNETKETLSITIEDNGVGIAKQDRKRVFKRYVRIQKGDRHEVKGFGLGLSYVKLTVEGMEGSIKISGKKGDGTVVKLCFPLSCTYEKRKKLYKNHKK